MVQRRGGLGFAAESFQGLAILSEIVGKKLQGNEAIEAGILGLVHHTHTAATQHLDDAVVRDGLVNHFSPRPGQSGMPMRFTSASNLGSPCRPSNIGWTFELQQEIFALLKCLLQPLEGRILLSQTRVTGPIK
jgi:hypothetical protein